MPAVSVLTLLTLTILPASMARAVPTLDRVATVSTPPATSWARFLDGQTLTVDEVGARRIVWQLTASRAQRLFTTPAPPTGLEAWGDSVLVRVAGELSRLVGPLNASSPVLKPANWHLPNTRIGGQDYRVLVDLDTYLLISTAPGTGTILGLLDFADIGEPATAGAFGGDRAVIATDGGLWVADLSNPLVPAFRQRIEPPDPSWRASDLAVQDRVLYVLWGGRLQAWDLLNPADAQLLDDLASDDTRLVAAAGRLATWSDGAPGVRVHDTANPAELALQAELPADQPGEVTLQGDRVLIGDGVDLVSVRVPPAPAPPVFDGEAYPVLQGTRLASDGRHAWVQDGTTRRAVALGVGELAPAQDGPAPAGDDPRDALLLAGDLLLHLRAGSGVDVFDLADPLAPQLQTTLATTPAPLAAAVDGSLLALADGQQLALYDLADPASPVARGTVPLTGTPQTVALRGAVAVLMTGDHAAAETGRLHVVDVADPDQPGLVTSETVDPDGDGSPWQPTVSRWHGDVLRVLLWQPQEGAAARAATATVDLADPQQPQLAVTFAQRGQWCAGPDADGLLEPRPFAAPAGLGDLHASFSADTVAVYADPGGPGDLVREAFWRAPGPVIQMAADGNRLVVFSDNRVDLLSYSDDALVAAPVPAALATAVRAVPNPFNPTTTLHFTMPASGTAEIALFDLRGRRVRSLRAELPAGPATVRLAGVGAAGRPLASGAYLVRVRTAQATLTGRCQLVR
jgi:hypothetical protein